jgi:outer membrane protein, multidrug efflux system
MRGTLAKSTLTLSLLATILSLGCVVGPKYVKPSITPPPEFRGASTPGDGNSVADLKWFEVFQDPQLQDLLKKALQNNYDLREAAARIEEAHAQLGITRADQFPTIGGSAGVTTTRTSANGPFALPENFDTSRSYGSIALNLASYEVDLWGRLRNATAASKAELLGSQENRKTVITSVISDVTTSYYDLLELDTQLEIAKRTLATREQSLRLIKAREQAGAASTLDVRQGEQLVEVAAESIPSIEQQVEQTENRLQLLLGESPGPIMRTRLLEQKAMPAVPAGMPSKLLERRPDIQAAEQNLIASNAMIGVARAAYFPTISLTAVFGFQSNQLSSLFTGPNKAWEFAPQVAQPIFNGGRIRSNVAFAKAQQNLALVQYQRSIQTAFREVSDSLVQYEKVKDVRGKQEQLVATLQDRSRLSYVRYRGGADTLLSALDADRDLFDAELHLAELRRDELVSVVQIYRSLGGGWQ